MKLQEYETVVVIDPELSEEQREELLTKLENFITQSEGVFKEIERWGLRDLAYEINHKPKGYYALLHYCGKSDIVERLERTLRMNDKILRFLTLKVSPKVSSEPPLETQVAAGQ